MEMMTLPLKPLEPLLIKIISSPSLHAKWLNTLSYLENCGARKIARCEHPTQVKEEMLKHAAEEFRHAYYLKQQIKKLSQDNFDSYRKENLLGSTSSLHYLHALDIAASRFLKKTTGLQGGDLKNIAYLLVTYVIELRASFLYPAYETCLKKLGSPVHVKSIVLEEEEHLLDMQRELTAIPQGLVYASHLIYFESELFSSWLNAIQMSIDLT
jgi:hypothetical protein